MAQVNLNSTQPTTQLNGGITDSATAVTTDGNTGFPTAPFEAQINSEVWSVTSTGSGTNWTVVRGHAGTTAAAHSDNDVIKLVISHRGFGLLPDEATTKYYAQGDVDMDGNWLLNFSVAAAMKNSSDQAITANTDDEIDFATTVYASPASAVSLTDNAFVAPVDGVYSARLRISTNNITTGSDFRVKAAIDDAAPADVDGEWILRTDMVNARYYWAFFEGEMVANEKLTFTIWIPTADTLTVRGATAEQRTVAYFTRVG